MRPKVGVIGLGIMGSAMSSNLLANGFEVSGFDIDPQRCEAFAAQNGIVLDSCQAVAESTDVIITSLPSIPALQSVVGDKQGIAAAQGRGQIIIDTSTLTVEAKCKAHEALKAAGMEFLDCPLSGTGAQAAKKDLVVYTSGNKSACEKCTPVFDGFSRAQYYVGGVGMGSKMKFVANLLVTIHNVSAAEAFVLGMKSGLKPDMIYQAITDGAGTSRMFEVRGPMMVNGQYDQATMKMEMHQKDINIISDFAKSCQCPTPLLSAAALLYTSALANGRNKQDTAAVCAVLEEMAGVKRA